MDSSTEEHYKQQLKCLKKNQLVDLILVALRDNSDIRHVVDAIMEKKKGSGEASDTGSTAKEEDILPNEALRPVAFKKNSVFDMSRYKQRHIAMHVQYDGSKYLGFASSPGGETVEQHLFDALTKVRLIEDRKSCGYSRCGRTDKGVSALGQVIALRLRSAFPIDPNDSTENVPLGLHPEDVLEVVEVVKDKPRKTKAGEGPLQVSKDTEDGSGNGASGSSADSRTVKKVVRELDYCQMLNRNLPTEIRVLGWTEVTPDFSARFSATSRTYRYFFLRKDLDISAMRTAALLLVGDHDFRNICKMDMANVTNFRREIFSACIEPFAAENSATEEDVYFLEIRGVAFLWHMVRCIMALLFLVGEKKENPDIITRLLDIDALPAKPEYTMAADLPLVLHESGFAALSCQYQPSVLWSLTAHYEALWEEHTLAAARVKNALHYIAGLPVRKCDVEAFENSLSESVKQKQKQINKRGCNNKRKSVGALTETSNMDKDKRGRYEERDSPPPAPCYVEDESCRFEASGDDRPKESHIATEISAGTTGGGVEVVVWRNVLQQMFLVHGMRPRTPAGKGNALASTGGRGGAAHHIPLLQRPRADSYETRKRQLTGIKKERLDRHTEAKSNAAPEKTSEFFKRMRNEGSVS